MTIYKYARVIESLRFRCPIESVSAVIELDRMGNWALMMIMMIINSAKFTGKKKQTKKDKRKKRLNAKFESQASTVSGTVPSTKAIQRANYMHLRTSVHTTQSG